MAWIESQDSLQDVAGCWFHPLSSVQLRWSDELLPNAPRHLPTSSELLIPISGQQGKIEGEGIWLF